MQATVVTNQAAERMTDAVGIVRMRPIRPAGDVRETTHRHPHEISNGSVPAVFRAKRAKVLL
jgi:hypothetical protein